MPIGEQGFVPCVLFRVSLLPWQRFIEVNLVLRIGKSYESILLGCSSFTFHMSLFLHIVCIFLS